MKKLIIVTMIAACVALCAAVWPHGNTVETPVPAAETAVSAQEATVAEIEKPAALAEKEKGTIPRQESPQEEQNNSSSLAGFALMRGVFLFSCCARYGRRSTLESTASQSTLLKNAFTLAAWVGSYQARRVSASSASVLYLRKALRLTVLWVRYSSRSGRMPLLAESISSPVRRNRNRPPS